MKLKVRNLIFLAASTFVAASAVADTPTEVVEKFYDRTVGPFRHIFDEHQKTNIRMTRVLVNFNEAVEKSDVWAQLGFAPDLGAAFGRIDQAVRAIPDQGGADTEIYNFENKLKYLAFWSRKIVMWHYLVAPWFEFTSVDAMIQNPIGYMDTLPRLVTFLRLNSDFGFFAFEFGKVMESLQLPPENERQIFAAVFNAVPRFTPTAMQDNYVQANYFSRDLIAVNVEDARKRLSADYVARLKRNSSNILQQKGYIARYGDEIKRFHEYWLSTVTSGLVLPALAGTQGAGLAAATMEVAAAAAKAAGPVVLRTKLLALASLVPAPIVGILASTTVLATYRVESQITTDLQKGADKILADILETYSSRKYWRESGFAKLYEVQSRLPRPAQSAYVVEPSAPWMSFPDPVCLALLKLNARKNSK